MQTALTTSSSVLRHAFLIVRKDAWLTGLVFLSPILLGFVLWLIFSTRFATDLPIYIVDNDNSALSRKLIRNFSASPTLAVSQVGNEIASAERLLRAGKVYSVVIVPKHFEADTLTGHSPVVNARYNAQFVLIGKLIKSALLQAHGTFNAEVEIVKNMMKNQGNITSAMSTALPIRQQVTSLYNGKNDYSQFLVSASVPALLQIIIMSSAVLFLARLNHNAPKTLTVFAHLKHTVGHLWLLTIVMWVYFIALLLIAIFIVQWPFSGSLLILAVGSFLFVFSCQAMAMMLFCLTRDATRAMSLVAGISAPAFAFMGVTFPVHNMPELAQIWRSILPVSHFIELQNQQMNYGHINQTTFTSLAMMMFMSLFFIVGSLLWARKPQMVSPQ